ARSAKLSSAWFSICSAPNAVTETGAVIEVSLRLRAVTTTSSMARRAAGAAPVCFGGGVFWARADAATRQLSRDNFETPAYVMCEPSLFLLVGKVDWIPHNWPRSDEWDSAIAAPPGCARKVAGRTSSATGRAAPPARKP